MTAGEAGPRGADVRSDVWIRVEPRDSGGIETHVRSKVELLYGDHLRRQVADGLAALDVTHARVDVEDQGALPLVIAARLEAAVHAAGLGTGRHVLPDPRNAGPSARDRFRRSRLYLPGTNPKFMMNAGLYGADGVILDLEDSVAPREKPAARPLVRNALRFLDWGGAERMVRINQLPLGLEDLPYVVGHGAQMILIPKTESQEQVVAVAEACARLDVSESPPWLMPILESAKGIFAAERIARAHPTVVALTLGLEDLTADLGAKRTDEGRESQWARSVVVAAARAAGITPIDTVHSDFENLDSLRTAVAEARDFGFEGKGCIHPRQVRVVNEGFTPAGEDLARAKRIVLAWDEAEAAGRGVVSLGSKMIDAPVVKRARRAVELAVAGGTLPADWKEREHAGHA
ncbi:MAG: aldolase/citrate lyase family protein [bacterium]